MTSSILLSTTVVGFLLSYQRNDISLDVVLIIFPCFFGTLLYHSRSLRRFVFVTSYVLLGVGTLVSLFDHSRSLNIPLVTLSVSISL